MQFKKEEEGYLIKEFGDHGYISYNLLSGFDLSFKPSGNMIEHFFSKMSKSHTERNFLKKQQTSKNC